MEYLTLALSLAWPQIVVAVLWLLVGLVALRYRLMTKRPIFLFAGIAALLLSPSEILSPLRLALRYVTHRVYCPSTDACTVELQFGAAKYEWLLVGLAAVIFFVGLYLEVARARRRAEANNAVGAAADKVSKSAPASAFAGSYQGDVAAPSTADYGAAPRNGSDQGPLEDLLDDDLAPPEYEQPRAYRRPAPGSGSGPF